MSTKNVNNYSYKIFRDVFGQLHKQEYEATKKQINKLTNLASTWPNQKYFQSAIICDTQQ